MVQQSVYRLPSPPTEYEQRWANQYTAALERLQLQIWAAINDIINGNLSLTVGTTAIASGTSHTLLFDNGGLLGEITNGTTGQVLTATTGANPAFVALPANVSSFNAGTTGFTPNSATTGAVTLSGTLVIGNGGTGQTVTKQIAQIVSAQTGAAATGTTVIPGDDTIPQITEGDQYMTLAITPKSATSILYISVVAVCSSNAAGATLGVVLFQDATANALAATLVTQGTASGLNTVPLNHVMTSGTTSATTFRIRIGANIAGTTTFNGNAGARLYGGAMASGIRIIEVWP